MKTGNRCQVSGTNGRQTAENKTTCWQSGLSLIFKTQTEDLGFTRQTPRTIVELERIEKERDAVRCFSLGFSLLILSGAIAAAQSSTLRSAPRPLPRATLSRCQQLYTNLQPSARSWVDTQARNIVKQHKFDASELRASVLERFPSLASGQNGDAMDMVLMILTASIQDADNDKKYYLQKLADINTISQQLSNQVAQLAQSQALAGSRSKSDADPCTTSYCQSLSSRMANLNAAGARLPHPLHLQTPANPTYQDLQRLRSEMQAQANSLNDESQMDQVNLQNAMQDYNQAVTLISDVLKEKNDTAISTINNLK